LYFLCFPKILDGDSLFPGGGQYERYRRKFSELLQRDDVKQELARRGLVPSDIGCHSPRKGAGTYVSSGSTAIHIHMGWVMPGVANTYLRYESAGNQYVGRCFRSYGWFRGERNYSKLLKKTMSRLESTIEDISRNQIRQTLESQQEQDHDSVEAQWFNWGGGFRRAPEDFEFPKVNIMFAWQYWCCGDLKRNIVPIRNFESRMNILEEEAKRNTCGKHL
jgi:hypothetical protein